jgi:outer membrane protein assembly factor BamB
MKRHLFGIFLFAVVSLQNLNAQDWNQWRGPNRDGLSPSFKQPKVFPDELKKVWSVEVGIGHSSPVVSGEKVFLFSRIADQEVVAAYGRESGKLIWKDAYDVPYTMNPAAISHGKGPKSTPLVSNGKLYTFGITGVLSCYDAASGKLIWRNDFKKKFPVTSADFGTAMSPMIEKGMLIVHAGGPDNGALIALDAETGNEKWSWSGDGPAYASPIAVDLNGIRQIVTQSQKNIIGVAAANGELLWKIPFETDYAQNSITPVLYKDLLIFSGIDKGAFAVRITKEDGRWNPQTVWKNEKAAMYLSSPVLIGDYLYGMTHFRKGQFFCLDARTGETKWTSVGAEGENAAIINGGSVIFFLDNNADLTIVNATDKKYEVLKKYTVAKSPTWAEPAIIEDEIFIKDLNSLTLWTF